MSCPDRGRKAKLLACDLLKITAFPKKVETFTALFNSTGVCMFVGKCDKGLPCLNGCCHCLICTRSLTTSQEG